MIKPCFLSAVEARDALAQGIVSAKEMVQSCLDRIDEVDESIEAWAYLDREAVIKQAEQADQYRFKGLTLGPLHGVPVGIKDIIDTKDMPTERGTSICQGRQTDYDATLISLLREAGAIIMGKTVTTEMAVLTPGKTRNPHNPAHTPGGSSSGSAAAVASAMVPLSVGTQTNGSVIRPASFCGVYGFKPSFARISRHGVMLQSALLDTIGVYARTLEDLALVADVLMRFDDRDRSMTAIAPPQISRIMAEQEPTDLHFAFVRTPKWDQVEQDAKDGFRELIDSVNALKSGTVDIFDLPAGFEQAWQDHQTIMEADLAKSYESEYRDHRDEISPLLRQILERGQQVDADEYQASTGRVNDYRALLSEVFEDYDAIITPATLGSAPEGLETTGSPMMNTLWTLCGLPSLNLPLLQNEQGMPMGVQVVGNVLDDARLFRHARWLLELINEQE